MRAPGGTYEAPFLLPADRLALHAYAGLAAGFYLGLVVPGLAVARLTGQDAWRLAARQGDYPEISPGAANGAPRVWMHAVSVGEVVAAAPVIEELRNLCPSVQVFLTSATPQGRAHAARLLKGRATALFAPLDHPRAAGRALSILKPHVLALVETEIWPNWLMHARRAGIPVVMVNGRLSPRSLVGYRRILPLVRGALACVTVFGMIGHGDADRIRSLGAPRRKVSVLGNAKYDSLVWAADAEKARRASRVFPPGGPLLVAGSTRRGEEAAALRAFEGMRAALPDSRLALAPRHPARLPEVVGMIRAAGVPFALLSDLFAKDAPLTAPVLLVDTMGDLFSLYSAADVVFCGGSLAPLGGQNVLEPAVWGKPVLFGPHMEDFAEAADLLFSSGGGLRVADGEDLAARALWLAQNPGAARAMGAKAREVVFSRQGAARAHARLIARYLPME